MARLIASLGAPVVILVAVIALAAACSDGDDGEKPSAASPSSSASASGGAPSADPAFISRVGQVAGRLPKGDRKAAVAAVGEVVDGWLEAAYVGGKASFPGFTKGAAAKATQQAGLLSNAKIAGQIESVSVDRKVAKVDLLATDGRAVGATARVRLLFTTTGDYAHQVRVIARLFLTPDGGAWKVFGYDVRRSQL